MPERWLSLTGTMAQFAPEYSYVPDSIYNANPGKSYDQLISIYNGNKDFAVTLATALGKGVQKEFKEEYDSIGFVGIGSTLTLPRTGTSTMPKVGNPAMAIAGIIAVLAEAASSKSKTTTSFDFKYKFIFRSGSGNKRNLTPRPIDDDNGLFYFLKPSLGWTTFNVTAIEAVNMTGVLKAKPDPKNPNHYFVTPVDPFEMKIWQATRDGSNEPYYLTTILQSITVRIK